VVFVEELGEFRKSVLLRIIRVINESERGYVKSLMFVEG
jgi:hypothetical protein